MARSTAAQQSLTVRSPDQRGFAMACPACAERVADPSSRAAHHARSFGELGLGKLGQVQALA